MTTTRDDLLRAVLAEPDDDAPRLVLADWLEEHGDGEQDLARAHFIQMQVEAAGMPSGCVAVLKRDCDGGRIDWCLRCRLLREVAALFSFRGWRWMRDEMPADVGREYDRWNYQTQGDRLRILSKRDDDWSLYFRRGFVEAVTLDAAAWLRYGDDLLAATPLREVRLTTWPDHLLRADVSHATVDFLMPGRRPPVSVRVSGPAWESSPRDVWTAIRLAWNNWWSATGIRFHFPTP